MKKVVLFFDKNINKILFFTISLLIILFALPFFTTQRMQIDKEYTSKEDIARYIMQYHELPKNFITKYGLKYMNDNDFDSDGFVMGGDTHVNNGNLSAYGVKSDIMLKECDVVGGVYSINGNRGTLRLVFTCNVSNVRVFYTRDHYRTFTELTKFELQLTRNVFWIIFGCYSFLFLAFYVFLAICRKKLNIENNEEELKQI